MTDNKVAANDGTEVRVPGAAISGQAQADGSACEAGQPEGANAMDKAGPAPWDEGVEWEAGDEAGTEPEPGDDMPATDEMFEPETAATKGSDEEPPAGLKQLNHSMEQLLVTMDGLAADGADSRSMLERLTEGLLENPKAANRAGQIEDRIRVHTADFHRWVERDRRWRRWVPVAAASIALPAALLLGLLVQQHYQVIPLHDPTAGWRDHIWEHYGRRIFDCTAEAIASKAEVNCPLVIRKP